MSAFPVLLGKDDDALRRPTSTDRLNTGLAMEVLVEPLLQINRQFGAHAMLDALLNNYVHLSLTINGEARLAEILREAITELPRLAAILRARGSEQQGSA